MRGGKLLLPSLAVVLLLAVFVGLVVAAPTPEPTAPTAVPAATPVPASVAPPAHPGSGARPVAASLPTPGDNDSGSVLPVVGLGIILVVIAVMAAAIYYDVKKRRR